MKTLLLLFAVPLIVSAQEEDNSGLYAFGVSGITIVKQTYFNHDEKRSKEYTSRTIFFQLPIGYNKSGFLLDRNNLLVEISSMYSGEAFVSLAAGFKFDISKVVSLGLLYNISDDISYIKPMNFKHTYYQNMTARIYVWDFVLQAVRINHCYYLGIGFGGLLKR